MSVLDPLARAPGPAPDGAASEAAGALDAALARLAHELKTPLTVITVTTQMAARQTERHAAADATAATLTADLAYIRYLLTLSQRSIARLTRSVGHLLDDAHLQVAPLRVHLEVDDLVRVVREATEGQRALWPDRAITAELPAGPLPVRMDRERIRGVVAHYLANACKYSPPDRPVRVTLRQEDGTIAVAVRDAGPGLTAEQQAHVWDRFYRVAGGAAADPAASSEVGLGLGLYLARAVIEQQGGQVGVESTLGAGSTFRLTLPAGTREDGVAPHGGVGAG